MKNTINHVNNLILDEKKNISFIKKKSEKDLKIILHRIKKDIHNTHKYSLSKIIKYILSDIDNLEKSIHLSSLNKNLNFITKELKNILKYFFQLFKQYNITVINQTNIKFNPKIHEAIAISYSKEIKSNYIITIMQKGYLLHKRLLRPAMVLVSK
ncbi:nucleotide exchange factor GrpE [Buchnera aphidicola]|uniref:Protein GrpE n=1 Tax=Buchnera aphidicola (Therioaphis trifolii) TaxID=1241884 RepID=A0A4D6YM37_9GAMM|nr:nucleotide exchange factor GrpE [Buchnera aphidicola]QCI27170.1 nucleotide exchange factor GrpE [Buchnera aphidicola (Therioaphis trifolii)]